MAQNNWTGELTRLLWLLGLCSGIGLLLDGIWFALAAGCLCYISWNLWQLKKLQEWIESADLLDPPELPGLWGDFADRIYRLQKEEWEIQTRLEREVAYLRDSFTSLNDSVVMINRNDAIDWCNHAAIRNLGFRLPEDYNQHLLNLLRDPVFVDYYESADYTGSVQIHSPIDNDRLLLVQITRFGLGNRLLFARDVTEIHKLEIMRKDFVSNVSHELRTPLTVINGYIDNFMMLYGNDPRMQKPLQQVSQHAQRMEHLIRDLLELSRLETLPNEMHTTRVSITDLAMRVVDEARLSLPNNQQRQITVKFDEPIEIYGQPTELHSALLNLVINACKYTADQGRIDVHCRKDGEGAYFSVTDNGVGIDPLEIPRLTERFYRADKSRSMDTGGTGLGLAIVKRVLLRHEAELVITSTPGKGSCFTCHFPLHRMVAVKARTA